MPWLPGPVATNTGEGSSTTGNTCPASQSASTASVMSQPSPARVTCCVAVPGNTPAPRSSSAAGAHADGAASPSRHPSPQVPVEHPRPVRLVRRRPDPPVRVRKVEPERLRRQRRGQHQVRLHPGRGHLQLQRRRRRRVRVGHRRPDPHRNPQPQARRRHRHRPTRHVQRQQLRRRRPIDTRRASPSATSGSDAVPDPVSAAVSGTHDAPSRRAPARRNAGCW